MNAQIRVHHTQHQAPSDLVTKQGLALARFAMCIASAKGNLRYAEVMAQERWPNDKGLSHTIKAAVSAGGLNPSGAWGSELGTYRGALAEFVALVQQQSIIGRLEGIRQVPFRVPVGRLTRGASAKWVGEGGAKSVSTVGYDPASLDVRKLVSVLVVSDELARFESPQAEISVRDDMLRAVKEAMDITFIGTDAAVSNVAPAGILQGVTPIASSGNAKDDLVAIIEAFQGDLTRAVFVMDPITATQLSSPTYPNIGARGGDLLGVPALTSSAVARDTAGGRIVLLDPGLILYGIDGARLDASNEASVFMSDSPSSPANQTSMFQTDCRALLTEIACDWEAPTSAAAFIDGVNYA